MADTSDRWHRRHPADDEPRCKEHGLVPSVDHGRGKRWLARWRDDSDHQHKESYARKVDADARLVEVLGDAQRGIYVDAAGGKRKLRDYALEWLAAQTFDPSTREAVEWRLRLHILPELGDKELRNVRPSTVQAWLSGLADTLAPNYVRVVFAHLTAIMRAAVDDALIGRSPCAASSVKPPAPERPRIVPWTTERVAAITAALPERHRVVAVLARGLGLRQGECLALSVDDADWLKRVVHVRRQLKVVGKQPVFAPPKGGKERDVPLPEQVSLLLAAYLQSYPAAPVTLPWKSPDGRPVTARLFMTSREGRAVRGASFNQKWRPAVAAAGIKGEPETGLHQLRHHYASVLLEAGESIKAVAEYLGHRDETFTLRVYCHLLPASEQRARAAIDAAFTASAPDVPQEATDAP